MQSSRNTTESLTADQVNDALTRRLKKASAKTAKRKLETGEYVLHLGKIIPAKVLEEAAATAASEAAELVERASFDSVEVCAPYMSAARVGVNWLGSRKRLAATSVEIITRRPMHVTAAAPIKKNDSETVPKDGQLYAYDSKTDSMIPLKGRSIGNHEFLRPIIRRRRRLRPELNPFSIFTPKAK